MDDDTADLILRLQLEDYDRLSSSAKGKSVEGGPPSDAELALFLYQQELRQSHLMLSDRRMTRSIACAVQADGPLLTETVSEEMSAVRDRDLASRLSGIRVSSELVPWESAPAELDDELIAKLAALYVAETDGDGLAPAVSADQDDDTPSPGEASSFAAARGASSRSSANHRCIACQEEKRFFDIARAPCGHEYCRDCLHNLFETSMTDESLFPPRCCRQPIAMESARIYLSANLVRTFQQKKLELETPRRTYCSRPTCSVFIHPAGIEGDDATCQACGTVTCVMCKAAAHDGDCPEDTALQQVLEIAVESGWQRCHACRRLVELDTGCNHITCRCGAQFCYLCAQRWKQCTCAHWDETRIIARANQIVARQPDEGQGQRELQVAQAVENLRDRHQCEHRRWQFITGPNRCEECYGQLPQYIFECRQCQLRACNRCKRNRL